MSEYVDPDSEMFIPQYQRRYIEDQNDVELNDEQYMKKLEEEEKNG